MLCSSCSYEAPNTAAFCPACGASLDPGATPTQTRSGPPPARDVAGYAVFAAGERPLAHTSDSGVKFTPGTMLGERYRIATMLGRGGMGEVYRADDLKLGQSVALKFLPPALAQDAAALARFHAEVRAARQVAHPNVCRVYDIGEHQGRIFLSMEYIDGEDLASLLRRIGRLPGDKAIEIARQLCAGVAAAHDAGVLHRDLKPANVMIDGRGRAHLTDFGVAGLLAEIEASGMGGGGGRPAYMAPEQLARGEVSVRSDIFSLGLILYEMFTGKRAFEGATPAERLRKLEQASPSSPSRPSLLVDGIDPSVERAILKCLERDPAARRSSALEVARVFPGGDQLAAALAAGETPSPEMVAAAGGKGSLERGPAWMMLCATVACLAIGAALGPWVTEVGLAPVEQSPEELSVHARGIVKKLGYTDPPADTYAGFGGNPDFLLQRAKRLPSPQGWRTLRDAEQSHHLFVYRQSPRSLAALSGDVPTSGDPPLTVTGMVNLTLDTRGPLLRFAAVAP